MSFFWFLAGANQFILKQCPSDQNKFTKVGLTIFLTGIVASLTGGYAIYSSLNSNLLAGIVFGMIWGLLIINLDSLIVSTIRDDWSGIKKIAAALIRILISIMIGIVIAHPFELKLFDREIRKKLLDIEMDKCNEAITRDNRIQLVNKSEYQLVLQRLVREKSELENNRKCLSTLQQNEGAGVKIQLDCGTSSGEFGTGVAAAKTLYNNLGEQIKSLTKEISKKDSAISDMTARISRIDTIVNNSARNCNRDTIKKELNNRDLSLLEAHNTLIRLMWPRKKVLQPKSTLEISQNFNRQDSATTKPTASSFSVDTILPRNNNAKSDSMEVQLKPPLATIEYLENLEESSGVAWMVIFLTVLVILVETSPILVKLMQSGGKYEEMLAAYEKDFKEKSYVELIQQYPFIPNKKAYLKNFEATKETHKKLIQNHADISSAQSEIFLEWELNKLRLSNIRNSTSDLITKFSVQIKEKLENIVGKVLDNWENATIKDIESASSTNMNFAGQNLTQLVEDINHSILNTVKEFQSRIFNKSQPADSEETFSNTIKPHPEDTGIQPKIAETPPIGSDATSDITITSSEPEDTEIQPNVTATQVISPIAPSETITPPENAEIQLDMTTTQPTNSDTPSIAQSKDTEVPQDIAEVPVVESKDQSNTNDLEIGIGELKLDSVLGKQSTNTESNKNWFTEIPNDTLSQKKNWFKTE